MVALIKRQETNLKYLRFNALNIGLEFKLSPLKCKQKRSYVSFFREFNILKALSQKIRRETRCFNVQSIYLSGGRIVITKMCS